eukprot:TRINITY_DN25121_c0_g1_i1.p1 TRINITY_DN25121_c0_g1~~TRINITY_DN25121_c0_g1_i1.p1  ORF type:complete len:347 (+),score=49.06 TRINITY_DN25121_c0_g1_i1:47-1042(+)
MPCSPPSATTSCKVLGALEALRALEELEQEVNRGKEKIAEMQQDIREAERATRNAEEENTRTRNTMRDYSRLERKCLSGDETEQRSTITLKEERRFGAISEHFYKFLVSRNGLKTLEGEEMAQRTRLISSCVGGTTSIAMYFASQLTEPSLKMMHKIGELEAQQHSHKHTGSAVEGKHCEYLEGRIDGLLDALNARAPTEAAMLELGRARVELKQERTEKNRLREFSVELERGFSFMHRHMTIEGLFHDERHYRDAIRIQAHELFSLLFATALYTLPEPPAPSLRSYSSVSAPMPTPNESLYYSSTRSQEGCVVNPRFPRRLSSASSWKGF